MVQISDTLSHDSYEINADQKPLSITAGSPSGALYGLRSILKSTMLGQTVVTTSETPDVAQRIFHLDCGRKYFSKDWIISLVKELSWLQMNQLELDFSNGTGFRFALNDMSLDVDGDGTADEDLSVLPGGTTDPNSYLTEAEMDEIIETADAYGVEIVPCLDTPGHTGWIFGKEPFTKYSSNGDLDVDNQEATAFTKALVKKYAAYFVSKGCTTFHIGGDEYLHAYVGWLSHPASTEGKYASVAAYLDTLAYELKQLGVKKVRSFNDPLYYKGNTSTHKWQYVDEAEYWCYTGMNGFNYASPEVLAEQGIALINGNGDFYDILNNDAPDAEWKVTVGSANVKKSPAGTYAQFRNDLFAQNHTVSGHPVAGSTYFLWCDAAEKGTQQEAAASLFTRLRSASAKMHDEDASGTYEEFAQTFTTSAGGFSADGTLDTLPLPETKPIVSVKDQEAAASVSEKLLALPETIDLTCKTAVMEAREAYNSLTPEQKQMVSSEILARLEDAEKKLKTLEEETPTSQTLSGAVIAAIGTQHYTGKEITPAITVTFQNQVLAEGTDYTVSFQNNLNIGTASVTITGKNNYSGSKTATFAIELAAGSIWKIGALSYQASGTDNLQTLIVKTADKTKNTIKIPAFVKIGGKTFSVTEIAPNAFKNCRKLKNVTIGKQICKIGKKAFFNCKKLKKIKITTKKLTAKTVGAKAFGKTAKTAVVRIPKAKRKAYKKFLRKKGLAKAAKIK